LFVLAGTIALAGCRSDPLGPTGVQVDILTEDSRLFATSFTLTWMDESSPLFQTRVPEEGFIDEVHAPAVSVFIAQPERVGVRRVLVRGYRDETTLVSEGAARLVAVRGVWSQLGLPMYPAGSLPDQDGDGLPDSVDNCPKERDPCGSGQTMEADAGADAGEDAGVDVGPDPGPDVAPDLAPDTRFDPTGFPDGGPDGKRSER
jgi:hypothetical protein